jgi:hypothetical protein
VVGRKAREAEAAREARMRRKVAEDPCPLFRVEIEMGARRRQRYDGTWETYFPKGEK